MGIYQDIQKRTLIIDGAMGTMIQRHTLTEEDFRKDRFPDHPSPLKGNNDLLCITRPDIITDIHYAYLCAGADIIETNTFNAQHISMDDYGLTDCIEEVNQAAVKCARAAVERYYNEHGSEQKKYIAGAVGPTSKTASLSPKVEDPSYRAVTFDDLVHAYEEQITAMLQTGVDAILIETIFDTLNAKAAFFAAQQCISRSGKTAITHQNPNGDIALMASGTITDAAGRTLSGQTASAFAISLSHIPLFSIGLNCALGADQLITYVKELESISNCFISAYPNAGLPNALGQYDQGAHEMAEKVKPYLTGKHVQILGGCCGTTPDHIAAIAQLAHQLQSIKA